MSMNFTAGSFYPFDDNYTNMSGIIQPKPFTIHSCLDKNDLLTQHFKNPYQL